jgi:Bacterial Ig-like domain
MKKLLLLLALAATLTACPTSITSITATANPTTIASGATSSLSATVSGTGAFNAGVNWSIESGGGTLSATTGSSVTFTAPTVTVSTTVKIKATATGDAKVSQELSLSVTVGTNTAPTVLSVSPADGATGVTADAKIVVTFSKPMDQAATPMAYQSTSLPLSGVSFTWDASGTVLTIKPNAPLDYARGTTFTTAATPYAFTLSATAKDKTGVALAPLTVGFTTLRLITLSLVSDAGRGGSVFSDGYTITGETAYISVGDGENKVASRGFVSFDLSSVPNNRSGSELSRATLKLFKDSVSGDPYQNLALSCDPNVQCDQYASVNLDHVDYGPSVGSNDFYTPTLKALGVIDTLYVGLETYARADVLAGVQDDLNNRDIRENRSQYRLSFSVLTDGGNTTDKVFFLSEKPAAPSKRPLLILEYLTP